MALFLLSVLLLSAVPANASDTTPLYVSVTGPTVIGKGETAQYLVEAVGGPAEVSGGNYSYKASIMGPNTEDAYVLPTTGKSVTGRFYLNVTARGEVSSVILRVNVTSSSQTESVNKTVYYRITVVEPVTIVANIENGGNAQVNGLPVTIYADGKPIYSTNVTIAPGATYTLRYNWTDPELESGEHVITIILDPEQEFVTFEGGGTTYTMTFYYGKEDFGTWNILLAVLSGLLIFLTYSFYRRPTRRRK